MALTKGRLHKNDCPFTGVKFSEPKKRAMRNGFSSLKEPDGPGSGDIFETLWTGPGDSSKPKNTE